MVEFQCPTCHFLNIYRRCPSVDCFEDQWFLRIIKRALLDSFWSRRPSTVDGNLREARKSMEIARSLKIWSPLAMHPRGPHPLADMSGMGVAMTVLVRTLDPGKNSATVQFSTAKAQRTFYNNYVHTTPTGVSHVALTDNKSRTLFTNSAAHGPWYSRFTTGCHERMGDVVVKDRGISIDMLLALQDLLEEDWKVVMMSGSELEIFETATLGAASVVAFGLSLRGEEISLARIGDTRKGSMHGLANRSGPHLALSLIG